MKKYVALVLAALFVNVKAQIFFSPALHYNTGAMPQGVAAGDFNSDGKIDLAVANSNGNTITFLKGNGLGGFSNNLTWTSASIPKVPICMDINNDGKTDVVCANNNPVQSISVYLGTGTGAFNSLTHYNLGHGLNYIAAGDFNIDGNMDVAVVAYDSNYVFVLMGSNTGHLTLTDSIRIPSSALTIICTDVNADGKPDLVATDYFYSNTISVLIGNGTGGFASPLNYPAGFATSAVIDGDFNNDGKMDLAVCNDGPSKVVILPGNGAGAYSMAGTYSVGWYPLFMAAADFDKDGNMDIVSSNSSDSTVSVLRGNGNMTFASAVNFYVKLSPFGIITPDVNGDGLKDIVVCDQGSNKVSVLLNRSIVGISEQDALNSVMIYPNPANNGFTVKLPENDPGSKILLYSVEGVLLLEKTTVSETENMDISDLAQGVYFVKVESEGKTFVNRLIKN